MGGFKVERSRKGKPKSTDKGKERASQAPRISVVEWGPDRKVNPTDETSSAPPPRVQKPNVPRPGKVQKVFVKKGEVVPEPLKGSRERAAKAPETTPVAPIPDVAVAPARHKRDYLMEAQALPITVAADSVEQDYCHRHGHRTVVQPHVTLNPHGIAALNRRLATAYVLGHAASRGLRTLGDLWGNKRTPKIAAQLNDWPVRVSVLGGAHVPADLYRRTSEPGELDATLHRYDALMMVNVYQVGDDDSMTPVTPVIVRRLIDHYQAKVLYLVMHHFTDACGVIDKTGSYVSRPDGRVIFRPSAEDDVYGPHSDCSWAQCDGAGDGVAWTHLFRYGDLHVLACYVSDLIHTEHVPTQLISRQTVELPDFSDARTQWFYDWLPASALRAPFGAMWLFKIFGLRHKRGIVASQLVAVARRYLRYVKYNQFSMKIVYEKVYEAMKGEPFRTVIRCFPEMGSEFADLAVAQALIEVTAADQQMLAAINTTQGNSIAERTKQINALGSGPVQSSWAGWVLPMVLVAGGIALGAYGSAKVRGLTGMLQRLSLRLPVFPSAPSNFLMKRESYVVNVSSAILEEALRFFARLASPWLSLLTVPLYGYFDTRVQGTGLLRAISYHAVFCASAFVHPLLPTLLHVANNAYATYARNKHRAECKEAQRSWEDYRSTFLEGPIRDVPQQTSAEVRVCPIYDYRVRDRTDVRKWDAENAPLSRIVKVSRSAMGVDELLLYPPHDSFHYSFVAHNSPYFIPGNSGEMIWAALRRRVLRPCPLELHPDVGPFDAPLPVWKERFEGVYDAYEKRWKHLRNVIGPAIARHFSAPTVERPPRLPLEPLDEDYPPLLPDDEAQDPHVDKRDEKVRVVAAEPLAQIEFAAALPPWIDHLTHNKAKLVAFGDKVGNKIVTAREVPMHIKRNEKLFKRTDEGFLDPVARTIAAVRPEEIYATGPTVFEGHARLKKAFDFRIWEREPLYLDFEQETWPVHWVVGPMLDTELSELMSYLEAWHPSAPIVVVITAGDDALTCAWNGKEWIVLETDYAQFDQSQLDPALQAEYDVERLVGVPSHDVDLLEDSSFKNFVVSPAHNGTDRVSIAREYAQRNTGGNNTSNGNGTTNFYGVCGALFTGDAGWSLVKRGQGISRERLIRAFLDYGFKIKLKILHQTRHDEKLPNSMEVELVQSAFVGATFLKHVILPARHITDGDRALVACPLPSRILKIGTCLRDPRELYSVKDLTPDEHTRLIIAGMCFLRDQACNIEANWNFSLLRAFVNKYVGLRSDPMLMAIARARTDPENAYRVTAASGSSVFRGRLKRDWVVADEEVLAWGVQRYGIAWKGSDDLAVSILTGPPFGFWEHPLFEAMAAADYA